MKIAIVYDSHTGNTQQVANCIKEACSNEEIICFGTPEKIDEADLIFVGSWTDKGTCSQKIQTFINPLTHKKIAFFATAGFGGSTEYYDKLATRFDSLVDPSNNILGHFFCPGKMPSTIRDRYVKMIQENPEDKQLQVSIDNFDRASSHPDQQDLVNAKKYALEIIAKI